VRFLRLGSSFARLRVPLRLGKDAIDLPEPLAALVQAPPAAVAFGASPGWLGCGGARCLAVRAAGRLGGWARRAAGGG